MPQLKLDIALKSSTLDHKGRHLHTPGHHDHASAIAPPNDSLPAVIIPYFLIQNAAKQT